MNAVPEAFTEIGVRLPLLITGWLAVALLVVAVVAIALEYRYGAADIGLLVGGCAATFGVAVGIVWLVLLVPFDGRFQHYYEVSGTVTDVSNVLSEANGDLTRQPVVTLDSLDRPLVVDDPRAVSLLDQAVVLRCSIDWQYQAADSYSCRIVDFGGAR